MSDSNKQEGNIITVPTTKKKVEPFYKMPQRLRYVSRKTNITKGEIGNSCGPTYNGGKQGLGR